MIRKTRDSSRGCLLLLQRATEGRLKLLKQCPRRPIQIVRSIMIIRYTSLAEGVYIQEKVVL